jgi:hypothetical protein
MESFSGSVTLAKLHLTIENAVIIYEVGHLDGGFVSNAVIGQLFFFFSSFSLLVSPEVVCNNGGTECK